jgi:hypothetical protein
MPWMRLVWYGSLLLSLSAEIAFCQDWYVLARDPHAVAMVSGGHIQTHVPLDHPPESAHLSADGRRLFVLSWIRAKKKDPEGDRSQIAVIDTATGKMIRSVTVPARVTLFSPLDNTGNLLAFAPGVKRDGNRPSLPGAIALLDSHSLESKVFHTERPASHVAWSADYSRLYVLEEAVVEDHRIRSPARIQVFRGSSSGPVSTIAMPAGGDQMAISPDRRWLYVVDAGLHNHQGGKHLGMGLRLIRTDSFNRKHHRDGFVHVLDIERGTIAATHPMGTSPWKVYTDPDKGTISVLTHAADGVHGRLHDFRGPQIVRTAELGECPQFVIRSAEMRGRLAASFDELQFLPDDPAETGFSVMLASPKYGQIREAPIREWLGEHLLLPEQKRLIANLNTEPSLPGVDYPDPTRDVAIIDLKGGRVEKVIKVGRSSVKIARTVGQMALSAGIGMASGVATTGMGAHRGVWIAPVFGQSLNRGGRLATSHDASAVYALSPETRDVTIIRPDDGAVRDKIDVGRAYRMVSIGAGKQICALGEDEITCIDSGSQRISAKHHLDDDVIRGVVETGGSVMLLGRRSIVRLNPETAEKTGMVTGIESPIQVIPARVSGAAENYRPIIVPAVPEPVPALAGPAGAAQDTHQNREITAHFFRPLEDEYSLEKPSVFLDGVELARLPARSYFAATIPAGVHKLQLGSRKGRVYLIGLKDHSENYIQVKVTFTGHDVKTMEPRIGKLAMEGTRVIEHKWIRQGSRIIVPAQ